MADSLVIDIKDRGARQMLRARAPKKYRQAIQRSVKIVGVKGQRYMREEAPESGNSGGQSLSQQSVAEFGADGMSAKIYSKAPYAIFVELGTKPHFPPFHAGSPLDRWASSKGIPTFLVAKAIARKGTKPNPFTQRTFDRLEPEAHTVFRANIATATKELNL